MQDILKTIGVNINASFALIFISLIWVRILTMVSIIPFLFGKPVPRYVVMGASMMLALFVFMQIAPTTPPPLEENLLLIVMLYLKEAFYGLCIGFMVGLIFHGFSAVGDMIDNQRGVSIARLLIPQLGEQASLTGVFLFQFGVVLYLSMGGHLTFLDAFFRSYQTLPVLEFPAAGPGLFPMMDLMMRVTAEIIYISIQVAAPVIIVILISDIILGIANRMAPQINVWELGFNVKGFLGTLMLFVSITMVGDRIIFYTQESNKYAEQVIELLQGKVPTELKEELAPEDGKQKIEEGLPEVKTIK